ncbi:MAG TPA: NAD-dependent epimerase/dehydratase family protein [Thermoplasmata archaeon]|nr:NAD-dependent epimerase/dehydratase family protein [Thermoplasmata archaeon]
MVTGAAGFIGSHLVERLLASGWRVVGIDDLDPYYSPAMKLSNLAAVGTHRGFRLLRRDLLHLDLRPLVKPGTTIFHLAGQPGVRPSWGRPFERYVRNNVLVTQHLLEMARRSRPARLVYASSSSIYGAQPERPLPETTLPRPISPYGVTKLAAEHLVRVYRLAFGLPTVALRFFTVYGSRQRPDMAFHRFFEMARGHRPIPVYGDGSQKRDFTHVSDIVNGLVAAGHPDAPGEVYNLGGGSPATLSEALRHIEEVSGIALRLQRKALPVGDPPSTWADTRRAESDLGFRPKTRLREGLGEQWAWHQGGGRPRGRP